MAKTELKPCPFCGSEAHVDKNSYDNYLVYCEQCLAEGFKSNRKYIAIESWNRRSELKAELSALRSEDVPDSVKRIIFPSRPKPLDTKQENCPECKGTGSVSACDSPIAGRTICEKCNGTGLKESE